MAMRAFCRFSEIGSATLFLFHVPHARTPFLREEGSSPSLHGPPGPPKCLSVQLHNLLSPRTSPAAVAPILAHTCERRAPRPSRSLLPSAAERAREHDMRLPEACMLRGTHFLSSRATS
eukprot:6193640-Pleurochrysis_carterae.AAC.1